MKQLCQWMIWLYPPCWRRRYGQELRDLLTQMPQATAKDAVDTAAGVARAWMRAVWASVFGLELTVAALFFVVGLTNALVSSRDGYSVWRSTGLFMLLAVASMTACGVTGFLVSRRGQSVWRSAAGGLVLVLSALLIPGAILLAVCLYFESTAAAFHVENVSLPLLNEEFQRSREWFAHWGRAVRWSLVSSMVVGTSLAWIGGCLHLVIRRLRA